jgi:hypothetical protein
MPKSVSAFLGITALLASELCLGQGFGRVANTPYSGGVTVVNKLPVAAVDRAGVRVNAAAPAPNQVVHVELGPVLRKAWTDARPALQTMGENFLRERDIGGGFRTSSNHLNLAADGGQMFAGWDGRGFTIKWLLPGNNLKTRVRIPGPSREDDDPALTVPFDLELTLDVDINGTQMVTRSARLQAHAHDSSGRNFTGKAGVAVANVVKFVGGPDLVAELLKRINDRQVSFSAAINKELAKLNPALAKAGNGAAIVPGFDDARQSIQLTIVKAATTAVR